MITDTFGVHRRGGLGSELAQALRAAETAHGPHEQALGHRDEDWPTWYAEFMMRTFGDAAQTDEAAEGDQVQP